MTDNYDLDEHEHGHEAPDEHESKAEVWQEEDQPPVDDLTEGDGATVLEEEEGEHAQEDISESPPRKSSMLLPVTVGIGGLLLLGAVLYWQFNRSSSQSAQGFTPIASHSATASAGTGPGEAGIAPKTSLTNASQTSVAMPLPTASPSSMQAGTAMPNSAGVLPAGLSPPPANSMFPGAPKTSVQGSVQPVVPLTPMAALPPSNMVSGADEIDARIASLATRVDGMKNCLIRPYSN